MSGFVLPLPIIFPGLSLVVQSQGCHAYVRRDSGLELSTRHRTRPGLSSGVFVSLSRTECRRSQQRGLWYTTPLSPRRPGNPLSGEVPATLGSRSCGVQPPVGVLEPWILHFHPRSPPSRNGNQEPGSSPSVVSGQLSAVS